MNYSYWANTMDSIVLKGSPIPWSSLSLVMVRILQEGASRLKASVSFDNGSCSSSSSSSSFLSWMFIAPFLSPGARARSVISTGGILGMSCSHPSWELGRALEVSFEVFCARLCALGLYAGLGSEVASGNSEFGRTCFAGTGPQWLPLITVELGNVSCCEPASVEPLIWEESPLLFWNLSSPFLWSPLAITFCREKDEGWRGCNIAWVKKILFMKKLTFFLLFHYVLNFNISIGNFNAILSFLSLQY